MILDCFTFFNELDLLEGRLEYLYSHVDFFILTEANLTFAGNPKPMHFRNNLKRYKQYLDKVLYWPLWLDKTALDTSYNPITNSHWLVEHTQRNYLALAAKQFSEDSIVLINDLDEIPLISAIQESIKYLNEFKAITLLQDYYWYNLKQKQMNPWPGTVVTTNLQMQSQSPQFFRDARWQLPSLKNAGWHLSFWSDEQTIALKIREGSHQELNQPHFDNLTHIKNQIENGLDLYNRDNPMIKVDSKELPKDLVDIFGKYERK